jgi:hypothetical protein
MEEDSGDSDQKAFKAFLKVKHMYAGQQNTKAKKTLFWENSTVELNLLFSGSLLKYDFRSFFPL